MAASLSDLPGEIIYLILELGHLTAADAFALRGTCRALCDISLVPSFFICVVKNLSLQLPLPSNLSINDLPLEQLQDLCRQHQLSILNLACPEPKIKRANTLPLPDISGVNSVTYFAALHAGKQALILYEDGTLELWDLHHKDPRSGACDESDAEFVRVGKLLAEWEFASEGWEYDYQVLQDETIIFGVILRTDVRADPWPLQVIEIPPDPLVNNCRRILDTGFRAKSMSTISIRAGLAVVFCKLENAAALVIANYQATDGVARTFFCGVEYKWDYELVQCEDGTIMLMASGPTALEIQVYFNPRQLDPKIPTVCPDVSLSIPYASELRTSSWDTFRRRNPYTNSPIITLFSFSDWSDGEERTLEMQTVEDVDVEELLRSIRLGIREFPARRRNNFRLQTNILQSKDNHPLRTTVSRGFHSVWMEDAQGSVVVRMSTLREGLEFGLDMTERVQSLTLPVSLDSVSRLLSFCDESATLYVLTDPCSKGCCPRSLRILEY